MPKTVLIYYVLEKRRIMTNDSEPMQVSSDHILLTVICDALNESDKYPDFVFEIKELKTIELEDLPF